MWLEGELTTVMRMKVGLTTNDHSFTLEHLLECNSGVSTHELINGFIQVEIRGRYIKSESTCTTACL